VRLGFLVGSVKISNVPNVTHCSRVFVFPAKLKWWFQGTRCTCYQRLNCMQG
jgi:hypothetical protein